MTNDSFRIGRLEQKVTKLMGQMQHLLTEREALRGRDVWTKTEQEIEEMAYDIFSNSPDGRSVEDAFNEAEEFIAYRNARRDA